MRRNGLKKGKRSRRSLNIVVVNATTKGNAVINVLSLIVKNMSMINER
jgi:hypothetical protein